MSLFGSLLYFVIYFPAIILKVGGSLTLSNRTI